MICGLRALSVSAHVLVIACGICGVCTCYNCVDVMICLDSRELGPKIKSLGCLVLCFGLEEF